ncbi:phage tail family protein [Paenibacillus alvei]|uniref:phage tail domain-containing protein n=1 Tax=Paenibacillus alvei TaxID=44250 RepID=UPI0022809E24|nr:phage tail domain-containing protein [Paenibacillus alvei]MCY9737448.1 phage tail family protein [Paenibacillus alvei]
MTIMESIDFSYDGKYSRTYGIYNVRLDGSMYEENFSASRELHETTIRGNPVPYFHGVTYAPLEFELTFAFSKKWDDKTISEVVRWLCGQTYYKPLFLAENPSKIYYCICVDDPKIVHNGCREGYVKLKMRCDSPYVYSNIRTDKVLDFSSNPNGSPVQFINYGDVICKPEITIEKVGAGDISIFNLSNKNMEFKFTGLADKEIVYVDNEREDIITNIPLEYRYDNFNNNYLKMVRGVNNLKIVGNCKIQFRYRFKNLM